MSGAAPGAAASPCLGCGACCAGMRVSFYWGEADDAPGGWVPVRWTVAVSPHRRAMRGTETADGRCAALDGTIGRQVSCRIYDARPSPCREFDWRPGPSRARCEAARARHGLPPLEQAERVGGGDSP